MKRARVILADDRLLVTQGIGKLLESRFEPVGAVGDGRAAIEAARKARRHVIVLDVPRS